MSEKKSPPPEDEILTEAQCAVRLSVTRETLSRLRHDRDDPMPWVRFGKKKGKRPRVRYVWADVLAWLNARSSAAEGDAKPAPRKRGRPRNIDRARQAGQGGAR